MPKRDALIFGRIPARGERQRDRERSAGDAEHHAEQQDLRKLWMPRYQAMSKPER